MLFSLREPPQAIAARVGVRYPHLSRDVCAGPRGSRRLGCVPVRDIAVRKLGGEMYICMLLAVREELMTFPVLQ